MCANCVECDKYSEHQFVSFSKNLHSIISQQSETIVGDQLNCIREFDEKITQLELQVQKKGRLLEELKTARNSFESFCAEIEAFIHQNGKVPKTETILWFFREDFKKGDMKLNNFSADASCSTEAIRQSHVLTQTAENSIKRTTTNAETQISSPKTEARSQTNITKRFYYSLLFIFYFFFLFY